MSRDDLIQTNSKIVEGVTENVVKHSPNCIIVVVCNPLDAMCQMALHVSKFPKHRVFGQSGVLDSARFRTFISQELNVSVQDVFTCVLGAIIYLVISLLINALPALIGGGRLLY